MTLFCELKLGEIQGWKSGSGSYCKGGWALEEDGK